MSKQSNKALAGLKATEALLAVIIVMAAIIGVGVALKLGFLITKIAVIIVGAGLVVFLIWDHLRQWFLKKMDEEKEGGEE